MIFFMKFLIFNNYDDVFILVIIVFYSPRRDFF